MQSADVVELICVGKTESEMNLGFTVEAGVGDVAGVWFTCIGWCGRCVIYIGRPVGQCVVYVDCV